MEKREKEVNQFAKELLVKIIDWTKIEKAIGAQVGHDVEIKCGTAVIFDRKGNYEKGNGAETRSILLDKECCGVISETKNYFVSEATKQGAPMFTMQEFDGIGVFKKKENGSYFAPEFYVTIDVDDIKDCLTGEEMPLYEYMDSRYNYNPRIRGNENRVLEIFFGRAIYNAPTLKLEFGR